MRAAFLALALSLPLLAPPAGAADPSAPADGPCGAVAYEGARYTVCEIDLALHRLDLYWQDASGEAYGGFARLVEALDAVPLFAMNAGMYHADLAPVGLHVEDGTELSRASTADGPGNFHMKPNGVFYVSDGTAAVSETGAYLAAGHAPDLATQSGPMLVINGEIHPRFLADSTSLRRRNGVGVVDGSRVVFAISEGRVTFWDFAHLFRDGLGADDALYLDGSMSSLYAPALGRADALRPMGPIIAAFPRG